MLDLTLAALGGFLLGAGLTYIWHTHHGDAQEVVRLTREYDELYDRHQREMAELWAAVSMDHHRTIVVDRVTDG